MERGTLPDFRSCKARRESPRQVPRRIPLVFSICCHLTYPGTHHLPRAWHERSPAYRCCGRRANRLRHVQVSPLHERSKTVAEVEQLDVDELFSRPNLDEHLSPNRHVGVYAIFDLMKQQVRDLQFSSCGHDIPGKSRVEC